MSQEVLPMDVSESRGAKEGLAIRPGEMRLRRPVRNQGEMIVRDLDSLVAEDHSVRAVWAFLEGLDLSAFYASLKTSIDSPGRPASDPMVLLALWVYATAEGVGSARELDRLSQELMLTGGFVEGFRLTIICWLTFGSDIDRRWMGC